MRYALVNQDNDVVNVIEWDGVSSYTPPNNLEIEPITEAEIPIVEIGTKRRGKGQGFLRALEVISEVRERK